jgi:hypothetical protein
VDYAEYEEGVTGYFVECGIGVGLGVGDVVSDSDFVGACSFEAGEEALCITQHFYCAKILV